MTVEVNYPNDDDPGDPRKDVKTTIETVNEHLKGNTKSSEKSFTVQGIAKKLGVDEKTLTDWTVSDNEFLNGLKKFNEIQEMGIFEPDEFGISNRADAMVIAMLILETKHKHDLDQS